jgi:glycine/D-amino acid oxidase-like deaminating enzyme
MTEARSRPRRVDRQTDVVVIGGGIIGCAAAAMLADRGARVVLVERASIGAGASGRNLGAVQHPFDPVLARLHRESLTRYQALVGATDADWAIGSAPAGILLLHPDEASASAQASRLAATFPELAAQLVPAEDLVLLEPALAAGPSAVRVDTGYPIPPSSATAAWAALADQRGAIIEIGVGVTRVEVEAARAVGVVLDDGTGIGADAVLVAAGPWTPGIVDPGGAWRAIVPTYGVTVQLRLDDAAPHHILEEDDVDGVNRSAAATARAETIGGDAESEPPSLFSLASAGGVSTLGSTFLPAEPDAAQIEPVLLRRAAAFVPAIGGAEIVGRRMCARPQSVDGRPFIGPVPGTDGLFVCAGHGPWGISTGPASAAMVARAILDGTLPPPELEAARIG